MIILQKGVNPLTVTEIGAFCASIFTPEFSDSFLILYLFANNTHQLQFNRSWALSMPANCQVLWRINTHSSSSFTFLIHFYFFKKQSDQNRRDLSPDRLPLNAHQQPWLDQVTRGLEIHPGPSTRCHLLPPRRYQQEAGSKARNSQDLNQILW